MSPSLPYGTMGKERDTHREEDEVIHEGSMREDGSMSPASLSADDQ